MFLGGLQEEIHEKALIITFIKNAGINFSINMQNHRSRYRLKGMLFMGFNQPELSRPGPTTGANFIFKKRAIHVRDIF